MPDLNYTVNLDPSHALAGLRQLEAEMSRQIDRMRLSRCSASAIVRSLSASSHHTVAVTCATPFGVLRVRRIESSGGDWLRLDGPLTTGAEATLVVPIVQCAFQIETITPESAADRELIEFYR